jgi:hypothetical protein
MAKPKRIIGVYWKVLLLFVACQFVLFGLIKHSRQIDRGKFNVITTIDNNPSWSDTGGVSVDYDPAKHTLVQFHIQKTSGTNFAVELAKQMFVVTDEHKNNSMRACKGEKKYYTKDEVKIKRLLYSECKLDSNSSKSLFLYPIGSLFGWSCGLHPGLSDLKQCIENRSYPNPDLVTKNEDYLYVSMLREPVSRFYSEWKHVAKTGSIWIYDIPPRSQDQICTKSITFFFAFIKQTIRTYNCRFEYLREKFEFVAIF